MGMTIHDAIRNLDASRRASVLGQYRGAGARAPRGLPPCTVLAFDPSCDNLGWAILHRHESGLAERRASGCWHPRKGKDAPDRFDQLGLRVGDIVRMNDAERIVIETPSGGMRHSFKQLAVYCRAVGVVEGAAAVAKCGAVIRRVEVVKWKPRYGRLTEKKEQTRARVVPLFAGWEPGSDDEVDAVAIALWELQR